MTRVKSNDVTKHPLSCRAMRHMQMRGRGHHWPLPAVLCLGLLAILPVSAVPPTAGMPVHAGHGGGHRGGPVAGARLAAPESALRLQALLGQHALLAADFMRGRIRGDEDFAQAADAALGKNTEAMDRLVGDLFGAEAARAFAPKWAEHMVELFTYARGLADRDDAVRAEAREELIEYEEELAAFFVSASDGRLTTSAANRAIRQHVDHLLTQADAYAAGNYAAADRAYRESYRHAYDLGRSLAGALLPPRQTAALRAPTWRLRSELGKLLAEHVVLVEDATRAAVTDAPDFAAAGDLVNDNTRDLAAAVDSLFGAPAARDFQDLWGDHVEQLVAYATATATRDAARQATARAKLGEFETRLAAFLEAATGRRLGSGDLSAALKAHDEMLLRHADSFAAREYGTAHEIAYRAYEHMFELARQLSTAFGATVAARLPVGGVETGLGGLAKTGPASGGRAQRDGRR